MGKLVVAIKKEEMKKWGGGGGLNAGGDPGGGGGEEKKKKKRRQGGGGGGGLIARATTERSRVDHKWKEASASFPICAETNPYYQMVMWHGCSALIYAEGDR